MNFLRIPSGNDMKHDTIHEVHNFVLGSSKHVWGPM